METYALCASPLVSEQFLTFGMVFAVFAVFLKGF